MAVSDKARDDYERGRSDSKKGLFDTFVNDVTVQHPDSDAYYKGREGRDLDDDKEDE